MGSFSLHLLVVFVAIMFVQRYILHVDLCVYLSIHLRWWPKPLITNEHHHKSPEMTMKSPWNHQKWSWNHQGWIHPPDPVNRPTDPGTDQLATTTAWQPSAGKGHGTEWGSKKKRGWRSITWLWLKQQSIFRLNIMSNLIPIFLYLGFDVKTRLSGWAISCVCIFLKNDYTS